MANFEHNLAAYNAVEEALGGSGAQPNDIVAVRAIAVLEGVSGGPASLLDDNMVLRLNAIDVGAGGTGTHENTLDALNSIVILKGGVGGHENDLDAINEWVDVAGALLPLDAVAGADLAFSSRLLRAAYAGDALRVRRSSDSAELDIGFVAGELDIAAMETFCGAGDGFVVTFYDQSGNGDDLVQATAADQPKIVDSGSTLLQNGKPILRFDGGSDFMSVSVPASVQPVTVFGVITQITWTLTDYMWDGGGGITNSMALFQAVATPTLHANAGAALVLAPALALGTTGLISVVYDGVTSTLRLDDGAEVTGNLGAAAPAGLILSARGGGGRLGNVEHSEFILYPSALSAADQTTLRDNINAFLSIF